MTVRILGLGLSHDASAYALQDGEPVVGVQLERLTRRKHDGGVTRADFMVDYVLDAAGWSPGDIDLVVAAGTSHRASRAAAVGTVRLDGPGALHVPHHLAHACSAFGPSGFAEAAVLVVDANGDPHYDGLDDTPLPGHKHHASRSRRLARHEYQRPPLLECESTYAFTRSGYELVDRRVVGFGRSGLDGAHRWSDAVGLGHFYAEVARLVFGDPMAAGKVMGLAPYSRTALPLESILARDDTGYYLVESWREQLSDRLRQGSASGTFEAGGPGFEECADLASLVQRATEAYVGELATQAVTRTGSKRLCLAGGVALNAITNAKVARRGDVRELFVQPASSDAGLAVGAAVYGDYVVTGSFRGAQPAGDELGRRYSRSEVEDALATVEGLVVAEEVGDVALDAGRRLAGGQTIAWWSGGSEFGPRALGHRSILGDPRRADLPRWLNAEVKGREAFRPFAPAILAETIDEWFDAPSFCDFMLTVASVRPDKRHLVPAVVHVDGTTRLQAVRRPGGPFRGLIEAYAARTGVPLVLNTSFNGPGEPMVETPLDALLTFAAMPVDALALGPFVVTRSEQGRRLADAATLPVVAVEDPSCLTTLHEAVATALVGGLHNGGRTPRQLVAGLARSPGHPSQALRELQRLEALIGCGALRCR